MTFLTTAPVTPRFKALLDLPVRIMPRPLGIALAIFFIFVLASSPLQAAVDYDPLEPVNRATHSFNRVIDKILLKPLARTYQQLAPKFVKSGVSNFFGNLDDVAVTFNDLLQLEFKQAASDFGRLAVNTTVGMGGLFDVADAAFALEKNNQDFGQTLAHYGVESGPYVVLPFFGPSTLRDAFGMQFDALLDPVVGVDHVESRNGMLASKTVDFRADVLHVDDMIIGDDYLFIRGIYLQHREFEINGGYTEVAFDEF